MYNASLIVY